MLAELPNDGREADYVLEMTDAEAKALKKVVREADARKSETKLAQKLLGMR